MVYIEVDMIQVFNVHNFPRFKNHCKDKLFEEYDTRYEYYDDALISEGFISTVYYEDEDHWTMDELEFTLFSLIWS
jgi:hypothetical protein